MKGSILWTELRRCEKSKEERKAFPISTLATYTEGLLDRGISLVEEFFGKDNSYNCVGKTNI